MKKVSILFAVMSVMLLLIPTLALGKQELIRLDHISLRSDYGDLYSNSENPFYNARLRLKNDHTSRFDNVRVTIVIQEIGFRKSFNRFDIKSDKYFEESYPLFVGEEEEIEPGVYFARFTISEPNGYRRVRYRQIVVE